MTRLSVLDQSPIRSGATAADAVRETLELARLTDRLGYHRYWLAEHHSSGGLAGSSPEILVGHVAAETKRIRVGSGGVMLSHYSALKVAEIFRMLETLHPGRIDLGIGRAPGSDQLTSMALAHGPGALGIDQFPAQIRDDAQERFRESQTHYAEVEARLTQRMAHNPQALFALITLKFGQHMMRAQAEWCGEALELLDRAAAAGDPVADPAP